MCRSLKKCTDCEFVSYCNSDCQVCVCMCVCVCVRLQCMLYATLQRWDLPLHEAECKSVRGGATPFVRLALRALTNTKHLCARKM